MLTVRVVLAVVLLLAVAPAAAAYPTLWDAIQEDLERCSDKKIDPCFPHATLDCSTSMPCQRATAAFIFDLVPSPRPICTALQPPDVATECEGAVP